MNKNRNRKKDDLVSKIIRTKSASSPFIYSDGILYEDKYLKIHNIKAAFNGYQKEYFVQDSGTRAGIVAVKDDSVLFVRQYRLFINGISYEIPGGKVDEGEKPEDAAVRECIEETGVCCLNPKRLIFYHPGMDSAYNPTYIFYTTEFLEQHQPHKIHTNEVSGWEWIPLTKCVNMILSDEIVDSFSIISILAYQAHVNRE